MATVVCTSCGYVGAPTLVTKGSIGIEILLWFILPLMVGVSLGIAFALVFLLGGVIYSIWRHASRYRACPKCSQTTIIPADSPLGKKFIKDTFGGMPRIEGADTTAFEAGRALAQSLKSPIGPSGER